MNNKISNDFKKRVFQTYLSNPNLSMKELATHFNKKEHHISYIITEKLKNNKTSEFPANCLFKKDEWVGFPFHGCLIYGTVFSYLGIKDGAHLYNIQAVDKSKHKRLETELKKINPKKTQEIINVFETEEEFENDGAYADDDPEDKQPEKPFPRIGYSDPNDIDFTDLY